MWWAGLDAGWLVKPKELPGIAPEDAVLVLFTQVKIADPVDLAPDAGRER